MAKHDQHPDNVFENKMQVFNNLNHAATRYVQTAIENASETGQDATQNLVNSIIRRKK
ncbi:hypothetical protein [Bacillus sp. X1(2014)]|uniref:hypothetical protein n=1 Tax=Bacillus sp. X1(2014) TaxID=1565991 RepID=UPI0016425D64|nr:hypothetical protein [Bacillus sp. X1(2014)]